MAKQGVSDGKLYVGFWRIAVHLGVAIIVALSATTMLERYARLPHWAVTHDSHGRSLAGIIGMALALLVSRCLARLWPLAKRIEP